MPERDDLSQSFDRIPVQQVASYDLSQTDVTPMYDIPGRNVHALEERLREIVETRCWWLKEEWREKTVREQFDFQLPNGKTFSVYNYGKPLSAAETQSLQRAIEAYAQIREGRALDWAKNIVINNEERSEIGKLKGGKQFGRAHHANMDQRRDLATGHVVQLDDPTSISFLEINPRARMIPVEGGTYGQTPVSHFEGTIYHEFAHLLQVGLVREWAQTTGWHLQGDPRAYDRSNPPPTSYGQLGHDEDFAESTTHFLCHPDFSAHLRSHGAPLAQRAWENRRMFLEKYFGTPPSARRMSPVPMVRRKGAEIHMPKISDAIYYALVDEIPSVNPLERKSKLKLIKRISPTSASEQEHINAVRDTIEELRTKPSADIHRDSAQGERAPKSRSPQTGLQKFLTIVRKIFIGETREERDHRYREAWRSIEESKRKKRDKKEQ